MKTKKSASRTIFVLLCAFASLLEASAQTPIRVSGDSAFRYAPSITDSNTQQSVQFIRGDFTTFDVALFDNGILHSNLSRFTSISLAVFGAQNDTNPPQMLLSVTNVLSVPYFNTNTLTAAQWSNNPSGTTNYSAEFNFTDAQTSISLNSQPSASFWLRLFATTTDSIPRVVTYLEAPITVYDGPISPSYIQPSWYFGVFTDVNGNLISPADLWTQNEAGIAAALTAGGFSGGSGGGAPVSGNGINVVTNIGPPVTYTLSVAAKVVTNNFGSSGATTNTGFIASNIWVTGSPGSGSGILSVASEIIDYGSAWFNNLQVQNGIAGNLYGNVTGNLTGNVSGTANGNVTLYNGQSSNQVLYFPVTTNLQEMGTLTVNSIAGPNSSEPMTLSGMVQFPQPANAAPGSFVFGALTGTVSSYPEVMDVMPMSFLHPQYDDLQVVCGNSNNFTSRWMADATLSTPGIWENFTNITFSSSASPVIYNATMADRRIIDNPGVTGTNCQVILPNLTFPAIFPGITNWTRWININATVGLNYFDRSAGNPIGPLYGGLYWCVENEGSNTPATLSVCIAGSPHPFFTNQATATTNLVVPNGWGAIIKTHDGTNADVQWYPCSLASLVLPAQLAAQGTAVTNALAVQGAAVTNAHAVQGTAVTNALAVQGTANSNYFLNAGSSLNASYLNTGTVPAAAMPLAILTNSSGQISNTPWFPFTNGFASYGFTSNSMTFNWTNGNSIIISNNGQIYTNGVLFTGGSGGGGGSQTPWASTINGAGNVLTNVGTIYRGDQSNMTTGDPVLMIARTYGSGASGNGSGIAFNDNYTRGGNASFNSIDFWGTNNVNTSGHWARMQWRDVINSNINEYDMMGGSSADVQVNGIVTNFYGLNLQAPGVNGSVQGGSMINVAGKATGMLDSLHIGGGGGFLNGTFSCPSQFYFNSATFTNAPVFQSLTSTLLGVNSAHTPIAITLGNGFSAYNTTITAQETCVNKSGGTYQIVSSTDVDKTFYNATSAELYELPASPAAGEEYKFVVPVGGQQLRVTNAASLQCIFLQTNGPFSSVSANTIGSTLWLVYVNTNWVAFGPTNNWSSPWKPMTKSSAKNTKGKSKSGIMFYWVV
jgi:hypothetical protein